MPFQQLQIFAYGTYKDYQQAGLPALDAVQTRKLRQLTLASLAARHSHLGYDLLRAQLDIAELRELEDLVLDTVYQGLIDAKIDQQRQQVIVDFAVGRDVRDSDLVAIQAVLNSWLARSTAIMRVIEDKVNLARSEIKVEAMRREEFEQRVKDVKENIRLMLEQQEAEQRAGMRRQMVGAPAMVGGPGAVGPGGPRRGQDPRHPQFDPRDPRAQAGRKFF